MRDGLREHLQKSEIEYIVAHGGGYPETFKWDADIEAHAKRIGFRIKGRINPDHEWLLTGKVDICLYDGFVCCNTPTKRRRRNK